VAKEFADEHPTPEKLYTVAELGGWDKVNASLFEPETGSVAEIYDAATN
jgi:sulfate transport system substrate-binding protein